uniref:Prolyl endopeptidase n=1 Tax=Hucho hucho TaxID=62062 RepID=A0A4W5M000_9TELE
MFVWIQKGISKPAIHSFTQLILLRNPRTVTSKMSFQYPHAEDYHGIKIPDPYSWLENPDSEKTQAFVNAQNQLTLPYLEHCEVRDLLMERMTELYDYPKYNCPFKRGSRYCHFYNMGLQNQSVMYVQESLEAEPTVFLDPNTFSEDGTVALRGYAFSEDGTYLAYGTSASGSDWVEMRFLRVEGAVALNDRLERVKFSCMSWTHDGKGLFYNSYPKQEGKSDGTETSTNTHQKLYFHVLGTPQSQDCLCAEFPDHPKWMSGVEVSDDGRYVLLSIREGCDPVNRLWFCDLQTTPQCITGLLPWVKLIDNFDAEYEYVTNEGTVFTFKTNLGAPRYRLINIDFAQANWKELIPQHDKDVIVFATCTYNSLLFVCFLHDMKHVLKIYRLSSGEELRTFSLDVGSVVGFTGCKGDSEIFYYFISFLSPAIIYHCFDPSDYQTTQVFYPSKDGTEIPMFIVHKKGLKLDGFHPKYVSGEHHPCRNVSVVNITPVEISSSPSRYSPLHNICVPEGVQYPAVLLLTGDHDDCVVPLHSLKYIATLQHVVGHWSGQSNPLFIHVDTKSGHGAGKPTSKVIQEVADTYAFIARCLSLS